MFIKEVLRIFMTILYKRKGNPLLDQILRPKFSRRGIQSKFKLVRSYQTLYFFESSDAIHHGKITPGA